jgi:hypothetical protein
LFVKGHVLNQRSQFNPDLTNYGENAYFWTRQGCRRISACRQISKNRKFFLFIFLQKHEKFPKNLKIEYISAACRVNPPRPGVCFWTSFCP